MSYPANHPLHIIIAHILLQNGHHGEELPYIFGAPLSDQTAPFSGGVYSNAEKVLCEAVMRFFGNFIKSG